MSRKERLFTQQLNLPNFNGVYFEGHAGNRIFGPKGDEETGGLGKLLNEELRDL
jgi:hypothetical protein